LGIAKKDDCSSSSVDDLPAKPFPEINLPLLTTFFKERPAALTTHSVPFALLRMYVESCDCMYVQIVAQDFQCRQRCYLP
jgi:hypothetical protein